jgi:hypothetical protein
MRSRPERRRPRGHQQLTPLTASTPAKPMRHNARPILALAGFKSVLSMIKNQEFMPSTSDLRES